MKSNREDHLQKGTSASALESLLAGSISGGIARAVTAPLDTIKIRLQLQTESLKIIRGATDTFFNIVKHEGVLALWKGNVPAEILYILYGATQFTSYSVLSKLLYEYDERHKLALKSSSHSLIVGIGAGASSTLTTYPFDLLRTRLAANSKKEFLSMSHSIKQIWSQEGVLGFFAGIGPAILSIASTTSLMFWTYEIGRDYSRNYNGIPFIEGICGFIAGGVSKGITFPLDTIRKRFQMYSVMNPNGKTSTIKLCKRIIFKEGILGFYKGFGISVLKTAPSSALTLYFYEYSLTGIKELRKRETKLK